MAYQHHIDQCRSALGALLLVCALCTPAAAATLNTWDLTTGGTEVNPGDGNHYQFATAIGGVAPLEVYAFSDFDPDTPTDQTTLRSSDVFSNATGLGACNPNEDRVFIIFNLGCELEFLGGEADRPVDNNQERDWLLIYLPGEALNEWQSIQLETTAGLDMDVSYWIGTLADPTVVNNTEYTGLAGLGFGSRFDVAGDAAGAPLTLDFTTNPNIGNALLIGADFNGADDGFIISGVTALVPVPPAVWLFGSALLWVVGRGRMLTRGKQK